MGGREMQSSYISGCKRSMSIAYTMEGQGKPLWYCYEADANISIDQTLDDNHRRRAIREVATHSDLSIVSG